MSPHTMVLRKIHLEQSDKEIFTSHGGLTLLGQALGLARLDTQLKSLGRYQGMSHDDILKTYLGLLCTGKSDFEAAEGARNDPFFARRPRHQTGAVRGATAPTHGRTGAGIRPRH